MKALRKNVMVADTVAVMTRFAGYGAAAKGNTLLNYAGVRQDLLPYVVDRNPVKQGKYLPGCRIPIVTEACLQQNRPDFVLILPWNLRAEVVEQLSCIREWAVCNLSSRAEGWLRAL